MSGTPSHDDHQAAREDRHQASRADAPGHGGSTQPRRKRDNAISDQEERDNARPRTSPRGSPPRRAALRLTPPPRSTEPVGSNPRASTRSIHDKTRIRESAPREHIRHRRSRSPPRTGPAGSSRRARSPSMTPPGLTIAVNHQLEHFIKNAGIIRSRKEGDHWVVDHEGQRITCNTSFYCTLCHAKLELGALEAHVSGKRHTKAADQVTESQWRPPSTQTSKPSAEVPPPPEDLDTLAKRAKDHHFVKGQPLRMPDEPIQRKKESLEQHKKPPSSRPASTRGKRSKSSSTSSSATSSSSSSNRKKRRPRRHRQKRARRETPGKPSAPTTEDAIVLAAGGGSSGSRDRAPPFPPQPPVPPAHDAAIVAADASKQILPRRGPIAQRVHFDHGSRRSPEHIQVHRRCCQTPTTNAGRTSALYRAQSPSATT